MLLSFLSGFIISPRISSRAQASVQNIFSPVARPVGAIAHWTHDRFSHDAVRDLGSPGATRTSAELIVENNRLRIRLASIQGQLERLRERDAEREKLGDVRDLCSPFNVIGADSGPRDSLMLGATSFDHVAEAMPVLYPGGIAGRVWRAGIGGVQVMLVTDSQSKLTASFARFTKSPDGTPEFKPLAADAILVQGTGNKKMTAQISQRMAGEIGVRLEDWVVLSDRDWPTALQGYRVGRVTQVTPARSPGFVIIRIEPDSDLMRLREVMVMNK